MEQKSGFLFHIYLVYDPSEGTYHEINQIKKKIRWNRTFVPFSCGKNVHLKKKKKRPKTKTVFCSYFANGLLFHERETTVRFVNRIQINKTRVRYFYYIILYLFSKRKKSEKNGILF